jgi:hypothetical protein
MKKTSRLFPASWRIVRSYAALAIVLFLVWLPSARCQQAPKGVTSSIAHTAQAPPPAKTEELIVLLREQNSRLKAKIDQLEKENAELRQKLSLKQ